MCKEFYIVYDEKPMRPEYVDYTCFLCSINVKPDLRMKALLRLMKQDEFTEGDKDNMLAAFCELGASDHVMNIPDDVLNKIQKVIIGEKKTVEPENKDYVMYRNKEGDLIINYDLSETQADQ